MLCAIFIGPAVKAQTLTGSVEHPAFSIHVQDSLMFRKMFDRYDTLEDKDRRAAIRLLYQILQAARERKHYRAIHTALDKLGQQLLDDGKHREGIRVLQQALYYSKYKENADYKDYIYNKMGSAYADIGMYDSALHFYYKSLESLKGIGIRKGELDSSDVYNHIAIVWAALGEDKHAIESFRKAEVIARQKPSNEMQGMLLQNIGMMFMGDKQYDSAEIYYLRSYEIAKTHTFHLAASLYSLAQVADQKKDHKKAIKYIDEAIAAFRKQRYDAHTEIQLYSGKGQIYLHMKEYDKAIAILTSSLEHAQRIKYKKPQDAMFRYLARAYAGKKEYEKAYGYILKYTAHNDTLYKKERAKSLDIWMNARTAEQDKALVAQQLRITKQEGQLRSRNMWLGGTALSALLLFSISIPVIRSYRHKQKLRQSYIDDLEQKIEIDQLKAQVRGEEDERQRIADELHNEIASRLWAVNLNMQQLQDGEMDEAEYKVRLNNVFQQLTSVTQEVRKTAHNLMPDLLLEEGLSTALASVCEKLSNTTELEVDLQEYSLVPRLEREIELSIYRMVQELIYNVVKHGAGATQLLVQLSCVDTLLSITVEDNRTVFSEASYGEGLQQIKDRTKALSGLFDLHHVENKGTTAYLEFDLQHFL